MPRIIALLIAALLLPGLASAQGAPTIDVQAGETVMLRIGPDGGVSVASRSDAGALPNHEAAAFRQMAATPIVTGVTSQPPVTVARSETPAPPVARGTIKFTLRVVPAPAAKSADGDMLLTVENGYEGALRYRAVLRRGDRSEATDVCVVIPLKRGYEHWPYRFDRLALSDLRLIPWHDGDTVTCE